MAPTSAYLANHPIIGGNRLTLLVDGEQAYPAMLDAIANAKRSILLESYIYAPDATGRRFRDALVERARAGVEVRVLIDGVGSLGTPLSFFQPLIAEGGKVAVYRPVHRHLLSWKRLWTRDHRKILVVDDAKSFIGGLNVSDAYAPLDWGGEAWHDAHAEMDGPAAAALAAIVGRTWRKLTGEGIAVHTSPAVGDVDVQILESLLTHRHSVRKAYLHAIRTAKRTIRITNAYCIPDRMLRRALRGAIRRGVRVQLLLAGTTDVPAVTYASRALYARLMKMGVEIYEWTDRVLHAKAAVIDGAWCSIGSYNLDRRSLVHNLEANIACVDPVLGAAFDAEFESDIARSRRIDPRTWHRRSGLAKLLEVFFYQLRYLL